MTPILLFSLQFVVLVVWALCRYILSRKTKYFDNNEIHHLDFLLFAIAAPAYFALGLNIAGWLALIIPLLIATDDINQHITQSCTNNKNYESPLKSFAMHYISWWWRK